MTKKDRIVLDTNVLISALGWKGKPAEILDKVINGEATLLLSPPILDELKEVLFRPKFSFLEKRKKEEFMVLLTEFAEMVLPETRLDVPGIDQKDNRILECALEGGADYIVSGDRHILKLGTIGNSKIMDPSEFLSG